MSGMNGPVPSDETFLVLDFETADPYRDSACLVALVRVEQGHIVRQASYFIRPPRSHIALTHIHGITWDIVCNQPSFAELWPQLQSWWDGVDFFLAHNASFDRSVLRACCESAGLTPPDIDFRCTMKLARDTWNIRPTDLPHVCEFLKIPFTRQNYLSQALACAQVYLTWQTTSPQTSDPSSHRAEKTTMIAGETSETYTQSDAPSGAQSDAKTKKTKKRTSAPKITETPVTPNLSPTQIATFPEKTRATSAFEPTETSVLLEGTEVPFASLSPEVASSGILAEVLELLRSGAARVEQAPSVPRAVSDPSPVVEEHPKEATFPARREVVQRREQTQGHEQTPQREKSFNKTEDSLHHPTYQAQELHKAQGKKSKKSSRSKKKSSGVIQHSLSPSRLARFFYHDCERYLRYHITPESHREELQIPDIPYEYNPMMQMIRERGFAWEEKSLQAIQKDRIIHIAPGEGALHDRVHSWQETLHWFRSTSPGEGIYQPTLIIPSRFLARYEMDEEQVNFPACRPDLLLAESTEQGIKIRVIDMKASPALKTSHRIQVALYALLLRDIFAEEQLPLLVDLEEAGVWLYEQPQPTSFSLDTSCRILDEFLRYRLREILNKPIARVSWHLQLRCEWCEFFVHCRQQAEQERDVSLIPYLSSGGRQYLREAHWEENASVSSLLDLEQLLQRSDAAELLERCGSLRGQEDRLRHAVQALQQEKVVAYGCPSPSFPIREHVRIIMTFQNDLLSGQIYAAGFRRMMGKDIYESGVSDVLLVADTPAQCTDVRRKFIQALYQELLLLDEFNRGRAWKEQKTLQCYVFDAYEKTLFNEWLIESLRDPELAPQALPLLFYFQSESLVEATRHPVVPVPYPIIALTDAIRELVALPHPLLIRLQDALRSLPSSTFGYSYEQSDLLCFTLSNALKSDAIYLAWEKEHDKAVGWIEEELQKRLIATGVVIDGLRQQVHSNLVVWPPKFLFPEEQRFQHPEISRLAFITRYESLMGALEVRASRSLPYAERLREGISIPLRYRGSQRWEVLSNLDETSIRSDQGMFERILVPFGIEGEKLQMGYDDYGGRESWGAPRGPLHYASIAEIEADPADGKVRELKLLVKVHSTQIEPQPGDTMVLHPRYTDFTSTKILSRLAHLDHHEESNFLTLIREPQRFARSSHLSRSEQKRALDKAVQVGMTTSQIRAFTSMLTRRLTLVWGPPGTGKTHFLAQAVCCLLHTVPPSSPPLRIAVTAFTHAALENLLCEVHAMLTSSMEHADETSFLVYKWGKPVTARGEFLAWAAEKNPCEDPEHPVHTIVGGTVYGLDKALGTQIRPFDILLVDEGSQLKWSEMGLAMQCLLPEGRLVIAGDDLQLPPILHGVYPELQDGSPGLHESVFAYLRALDCLDTPYTCQLHENWRMNTTLCRFSADTLYGSQYQPALPAIAAQQLSVAPFSYRPKHIKQSGLSFAKGLSDFLEWLLDPDWPLVTCILEDTTETVENPIEAELLAHLSVALRKILLQPHAQKTYPSNSQGDREFWRKGLCIVSPHHLQIRAIRRALDALHDWKSPPFVDTVDKMQGQQAEAVFVSYGVSDRETALAEAEFIYSLHRLNVSVTRAKSKCLVCLPRPLLQSSFALLHHEKATQGLGHMHALVAFCREFGESREYVFTGALSQRSSRVTAFRCRIV